MMPPQLHPDRTKCALAGLFALLGGLLFILAKWPVLRDPMYWDAFAYAEQIRFLLQHRLHFADYAALQFLRPPVYSISVATAMWLFGDSLAVAHVTTWVWALAGLYAVYCLAGELGATARTRPIAVLLLALTPLFFSQSGLILSDLPACTLTNRYLADTVGTDPKIRASMSPSKHADQLRVPVLLIHGTEDKRAPISHADAMCDAIESAGRVCESRYFDGEGHGFWDDKNRFEAKQRALEFVGRYLRPSSSSTGPAKKN